MLKSAVVRACVILVGMSSGALAQVKLAGDASSFFGPVFEVWKFGNDGIPQPTVDGASSVRVTRASQWSIPVSVVVPAGSRLSFDLTTAYASSDVRISGTDPVTQTDGYTLKGISDVRIRATGHIVGDNVLLTAGINLPTGETELNPEELSALRVVGVRQLVRDAKAVHADLRSGRNPRGLQPRGRGPSLAGIQPPDWPVQHDVRAVGRFLR